VFNDIIDIVYFIVLVSSTGTPLKYQLMIGTGSLVARQVKEAVSPSFCVSSRLIARVTRWKHTVQLIATHTDRHMYANTHTHTHTSAISNKFHTYNVCLCIQLSIY